MAETQTQTQTTYKVATPTRHIDALRPHPDNPREDIDPNDPLILQLADSIEANGILEPLLITPDNMLIAGHRRRVASRVAAARNRPDLLIVPVAVKDVAPEMAIELMLQENMQRESLSPLEEAKAMYIIMERKKLTVGDLARHISQPLSTVTQRIAILKCEPAVQRLYAANELPLNAAAHLHHVANAEKQERMANMLARRQITLVQLKDLVYEEMHPRNGKKKTVQNSTETAKDIPKPGLNYRVPNGESAHVITRAEAVTSLGKVINKKISLVSVRSVLETVCCACGMKGESEICDKCPLPRFVMGIAGRAE